MGNLAGKRITPRLRGYTPGLFEAFFGPKAGRLAMNCLASEGKVFARLGMDVWPSELEDLVRDGLDEIADEIA